MWCLDSVLMFLVSGTLTSCSWAFKVSNLQHYISETAGYLTNFNKSFTFEQNSFLTI